MVPSSISNTRCVSDLFLTADSLFHEPENWQSDLALVMFRLLVFQNWQSPGPIPTDLLLQWVVATADSDIMSKCYYYFLIVTHAGIHWCLSLQCEPYLHEANSNQFMFCKPRQEVDMCHPQTGILPFLHNRVWTDLDLRHSSVVCCLLLAQVYQSFFSFPFHLLRKCIRQGQTAFLSLSASSAMPPTSSFSGPIGQVPRWDSLRYLDGT